MIIYIYWEKPELVSVKKAAIELKVPHIIGSLSRKLLQELARFTLGNLATSQGAYERASHAYSQRAFRSGGAPQDQESQVSVS